MCLVRENLFGSVSFDSEQLSCAFVKINRSTWADCFSKQLSDNNSVLTGVLFIQLSAPKRAAF